MEGPVPDIPTVRYKARNQRLLLFITRTASSALFCLIDELDAVLKVRLIDRHLSSWSLSSAVMQTAIT